MRNAILIGVAALALAACESGGTGGTTDTAAAPTGTTAGGTDGGGLINVNLSDISAEIGRNLSLALEDVPISVQLPVNVAANVCGVGVNVLSAQLDTGSATCNASTTSAELEQAIRNQTG